MEEGLNPSRCILQHLNTRSIFLNMSASYSPFLQGYKIIPILNCGIWLEKKNVVYNTGTVTSFVLHRKATSIEDYRLKTF